MEKRLSDRSSDAVSIYPQGRQFFVANLHQNSPNRDSSKIEQRQTDQFIFSEAVQIAGDWLDASDGTPLDIKQYDNLFKSGYASHPSPEILRIFHDWEDFQQISATYHQDRLKEEEQKQTALLEAIQRERELGLLPDELFKEAIPYTVRYCEVNPKNGQRGRVKKLQRAQLTENNANTEKVLERYAKYSLINYLLRDRPGEDAPTEERKVSMAMGFSVETGKALSSFKSSLKNSNALLSDIDIDEAIEKLDFHDLIYPDSKQQHFDELLSAGAEQLYDTRRMKMLGKIATLSYMKGEEEKPEYVHPLAELLLTDKLTEIEIKKPKKREQNRLTNEQILEYGRYLVSIVQAETGELTLNKKVIDRAHKLRLGLSAYQIVHRFNSLAKYYVELGLANAKSSKLFHEFELQDFVNVIAELGDRLERKPTREDIDSEAKVDPMFPTSNIISGRGFSLRQILDEAGWPDVYGWEQADHEQHGVRFMIANEGLLPTQKAWDFLSQRKRGPSASVIRYKYDDGFSEFKARVNRLYEEHLSQPEHSLHEATVLDNMKHLKLPEDYMTPRRKSLSNNGYEQPQMKLAA